MALHEWEFYLDGDSGRTRKRKIRCVRGHLLKGDNVFVDANGTRQCRLCQKLRPSADKQYHAAKVRAWRRRQREKP